MVGVTFFIVSVTIILYRFIRKQNTYVLLYYIMCKIYRYFMLQVAKI